MGRGIEKSILWSQFDGSVGHARRLLWDNIDLDHPENAYAKWENANEGAAKAAIQRDYTQEPLLKFYTSTSALCQEIRKPGARKWLQYGLCRRFGSIFHNFGEVTAVFHEQRRGPLATDEGFRVSDAVSLLYLHGSAVFDALSHAISETLELGPHRSPLNVDIARDQFRSQIKDTELRTTVDLHVEWLTGMREFFRHAIAHRIPPYIPTSSLSPDDVEELRRLDELYSAALQERRLKDAVKFHDQKMGLGQLAPIIVVDVDGSFTHVYPTVTEHVLRTIVASGEILRVLFQRYDLFD